jgi:CubicO group peptidase (beta-lactamase class C family)
LPLGLIDTGVCGTQNLPQPLGHAFLATGVKEVPAIHHSQMFSSGAVCSTAFDLARWSHLLASGRAILPASYETMTTPGRLNNGSVVPDNYGMGLYVMNMLGHRAVSHSGLTLGFASFFLYLADQEIAVAVIMNAAPPPSGRAPQIIAEAVAKAALGAL